ncbi:MAG: hypothetical protein II595_02225, partial [Desulfovibrio sp.]|nr:hypothetical protein [Desulfovibrio sp.]
MNAVQPVYEGRNLVQIYGGRTALSIGAFAVLPGEVVCLAYDNSPYWNVTRWSGCFTEDPDKVKTRNDFRQIWRN